MLNRTFNELKLEKHPDKSVIGRTEKGFDFLGYHFHPDGFSVAKKTVENFLARTSGFMSKSGRDRMVPPRSGCMSSDGSSG